MTPLQLGVPYSRPRYYALGRRRRPDGTCSFPVPSLPSGRPFPGPSGPLLEAALADKLDVSLACHQPPEGSSSAIAPISQFLESEGSALQMPGECQESPGMQNASLQEGSDSGDQAAREQPKQQASASQADSRSACEATATDQLGKAAGNGTLARHQHSLAQLDSSVQPRLAEATRTDVAHAAEQGAHNKHPWVPQNVIEQWGQSLDIVTAQSRRCNCFTKTYFRWVKASFKKRLVLPDLSLTECCSCHVATPA